MRGFLRAARDWLLAGGGERPQSEDAPGVFECSCANCAAACRVRPGWFLPDEAEALAANMGVPFETFFKTKLVVDTAETVEYGSVYILMPAMAGAKPGSVLPPNQFGQCTFYLEDGGLCGVHTKGKPFECAQATHTSRASTSAMVIAWLPYQQAIRELIS